jgi:uncharacterized protein (UPF0276 family)
MIGIGFRREMLDWDMSALDADFYEVVPENWLRRDRAPLYALRAMGKAVRLHGVSLNLGGTSAIPVAFLREMRSLMDDLQTPWYSDHLAASGDAHQLYDLFPIETSEREVLRVGDRIRRVQDLLGCRIAVENATWYTNRGSMPEAEFIAQVIEHADCHLLLDLNNVVVNQKNHGLSTLADFVARLDLERVSYVHVAGHEFDPRFGMYIDTHSQAVEPATALMARRLHETRGLDVLLEWDNDVPDVHTFNQEVACLRTFTTT